MFCNRVQLLVFTDIALEQVVMECVRGGSVGGQVFTGSMKEWSLHDLWILEQCEKLVDQTREEWGKYLGVTRKQVSDCGMRSSVMGDCDFKREAIVMNS